MKLLVNNIEQRQPDSKNGTDIVLFGRSAEDPETLIRVIVPDYEPYFYAPADEVAEDEDFLLSNDMVRRIEHDVDVDPFPDTSRDVSKIVTSYPQHVPDVAELFEDTWAADVPFTRRFRIDEDVYAYVDVPDDCVVDEMEREMIYQVDPAEIEGRKMDSSGV